MYRKYKLYKLLNCGQKIAQNIATLFICNRNGNKMLNDIKIFCYIHNLKENEEYFKTEKINFIKNKQIKNEYSIEHIHYTDVSNLIKKCMNISKSAFIVQYYHLKTKPSHSNYFIKPLQYNTPLEQIFKQSNLMAIICKLNNSNDNKKYLSRQIIYDEQLKNKFNEYTNDSWPQYFIQEYEEKFKTFPLPKNSCLIGHREATFPKTQFPQLYYNIKQQKFEILPNNYSNNFIKYFNIHPNEYFSLCYSYVPINYLSCYDINKYIQNHNFVLNSISCRLHFKLGHKLAMGLVNKKDAQNLTQISLQLIES